MLGWTVVRADLVEEALLLCGICAGGCFCKQSVQLLSHDSKGALLTGGGTTTRGCSHNLSEGDMCVTVSTRSQVQR